MDHSKNHPVRLQSPVNNDVPAHDKLKFMQSPIDSIDMIKRHLQLCEGQARATELAALPCSGCHQHNRRPA